MTNINEVLVGLTKSHAEGTVQVGVRHAKTQRLPTGVFPLDLAMGGGWPMGQMSVIYGPESSGKTNVALKTAAMAQKLYPDMYVVYIDIEKSLDKNWAAYLGVDVDRIIHVQPGWGEEAVDITHSLLQAGDVSLLVIDSIAAMVSLKSVEDDAEKALVGGNAVLVQKLTYKITHDLHNARLEGRYPVVLCVNQVRFQIGKMFGDPEKMPGGKAFEHASEMTVRVYGKKVIEKEINASMPAYNDTSARLVKTKVPTIASNATWKMQLLPHGGNPVGYIEDWPTVKAYLENIGWMRKEDKHWCLLDETFPTQKSIREEIYGNPDLGFNLRQKIIEHEISRVYAGALVKELEP